MRLIISMLAIISATEAGAYCRLDPIAYDDAGRLNNHLDYLACMIGEQQATIEQLRGEIQDIRSDIASVRSAIDDLPK